jgi:hypothetical protein
MRVANATRVLEDVLQKVDLSELPERSSLCLRMGVLKCAVLRVLTGAKEPLTPKQVYVLVENRLRVPVSYHSVGSVLRYAIKEPDPRVIRVGHGLYILKARRKP